MTYTLQPPGHRRSGMPSGASGGHRKPYIAPQSYYIYIEDTHVTEAFVADINNRKRAADGLNLSLAIVCIHAECENQRRKRIITCTFVYYIVCIYGTLIALVYLGINVGRITIVTQTHQLLGGYIGRFISR